MSRGSVIFPIVCHKTLSLIYEPLYITSCKDLNQTWQVGVKPQPTDKDYKFRSCIHVYYIPLPRISIYAFAKRTLWIFLNKSSNYFFIIHPQTVKRKIT